MTSAATTSIPGLNSGLTSGINGISGLNGGLNAGLNANLNLNTNALLTGAMAANPFAQAALAGLGNNAMFDPLAAATAFTNQFSSAVALAAAAQHGRKQRRSRTAFTKSIKRI